MNNSFSSSVDLIGPPVNMCAKINHCANHNEFVVGNDFHQFAKNFKEYEKSRIFTEKIQTVVQSPKQVI